MNGVLLSSEPLVRPWYARPRGSAPSGRSPAGGPEDVSALLRRARAIGVGGILCLYDPGLLSVLKRMEGGERLEVFPLVPNMLQYVRDMSRGVVNAAVKRLRVLGPGQMVGIGLRNMTRATGALKRDFRSVAPVMLEMELAAFARFRPNVVFLHAMLTDMIVAGENAELLHRYARLVRRVYRAEPAVQTGNLGLVASRLKEWRVDIHTIATPFNAKGYRMKPTRAACEVLANDPGLALVAEDVTAGGTLDLQEALAYLNGRSVSSVVIHPAGEEELDRMFRAVAASW